MPLKLRTLMPELTGATQWLNGSEVSRQELLNKKPTLIHFWSVSCSLCKDAMPMINEFRDKYTDQLNVVAVHLPRSEKDTDIDQVIEVAKTHAISQKIAIDNEHKITDVFENEHVPAYYVFDQEGLLRHIHAGGRGMKLLERRINRVLDV